MLAAWYETTPQIHHAVRAFVEAPRRMGARAMVIFGPPGAGKTALGEALAEGLNAALVFYQCHAWTDADELFVGVDVPAAVAGDAASVRQAGALLLAAEASRLGPVVLVIDEIDKAPERVDALLLDFLQNGRVPIRPGEHVQADLDRLYVLITSNGLRDLSDPLMRRARRLWMPPMPADLMERTATRLTGAPAGVIRIARKAAQEIAAADGAVLSLQELVRLIDELMLASGLDDVRNTLAAWAARGEEGEALARKTPHAAALWGEVRKHAR